MSPRLGFRNLAVTDGRAREQSERVDSNTGLAAASSKMKKRSVRTTIEGGGRLVSERSAGIAKENLLPQPGTKIRERVARSSRSGRVKVESESGP